MYHFCMVTMSVVQARANLSSALDEVANQPVLIQRRGKLAGVLISPKEFERMLQALEDLEDIQAFHESMAEEGEDLPWEQVLADLGWD
jgi:PHD/YefM family antitoxin component YafN of YafNO toxin-antitoxin module